MNIEEYISSGVVEAYVLGIATEEEVQTIEQLMLQYPQLVAAVREQEEVLINYAQENAVKPPPQLKQTIWEAISGEQINEAEPTIKNTPHISLVPDSDSGRIDWLKYGMAASIALLIASLAGNVWLMNENKKTENNVASLLSKMSSERDNAVAALDKVNAEMQILSLPKLLKINLAGVGTHTDHSGMLYWDGATGDVYVNLNKMPAAPAGKQYQLWAIVDGKPVDAGMYDNNSSIALHKMKTIPKAEMFAVTIENAGGSPTPTLDQMVVAGKTS